MRENGRRLAVLLGASLALASCSSPPSQPSGGNNSTTVSIPLTDYGGNQLPSFTPTQITIAAGNSVNWLNADTVAHTTTSDNNLWNANLAPGGSYSRQFPTAGTFTYACSVHPGMTGRVVVQ